MSTLLTNTEITFLKAQGIAEDQVLDCRSVPAKDATKLARKGGYKLVLRTPCKKSGHRLKTRYGHCAQCDPSKLAYQSRKRNPAFAYIAGSPSTRLLKVGIASDIDQRLKNLKHQSYGDQADWEMLFYIRVENAGDLEHRVLRSLESYSIKRDYNKDGKPRSAQELLQVRLSVVLSCLFREIGDFTHDEPWRTQNWKAYDRC